MTGTIDLLDEVMAQAALRFSTPGRSSRVVEAHDCGGCGERKPDVDLWAEDPETGEELWICLSCGSEV